MMTGGRPPRLATSPGGAFRIQPPSEFSSLPPSPCGDRSRAKQIQTSRKAAHSPS